MSSNDISSVSSNDTFTITTWNILAPSCADQTEQGFPYAKKEDLDTNTRLERIIDKLINIDSDVYCLQEVESEIFDAICDRLKPKGYKTYELYTSHRKHGVAIISRLDGSILQQDYMKNNKIITSQPFISALLTVGDRKVTIINAHLKAKLEFSYVRTGQIKYLLSLVDDTPHILCGDFNASPDEFSFRALNEKFDWTQINCRSFTTLKRRTKDVLITRISDYIYYQRNSLTLIDNTFELHKNLLSNGWPDSNMPSDHRPVTSTLKLLNVND